MARKYFSIEDGDLQTRSLVTSRNRLYSDIDLTFAKKASGDVYKKNDAAAVKQAIKNLLLTDLGEKPFNPYFGGGLNALLFELADDLLEDDINQEVAMAVKNWEPRAKILNVQSTIRPDLNNIFCRIEFHV